MMGVYARASTDRATLISKSLTRHRLVFVQMGAAFEPIRADVCAGLEGVEVTIEQRHKWHDISSSARTLIVTDLERCVDPAIDVLGEVREIVLSVLDAGKMVCLLSRAPRISFRSVIGSSVLEDAALVTLPLLSEPEVDLDPEQKKPWGWRWPSVSFDKELSVETYREALAELGHGLVAALDHALFEVNPNGTAGLEFLAARELEGLRGSGIVAIDQPGKPSLSEPRSSTLLREALAAHISETVVPASILPDVTSGLWYIERKIRAAVRSAAIEMYGSSWHTSSVGGLKDEVLRRAHLDTNVSAKSVSDLRDPLEWLTLGELMDLVRSSKFSNLGVEPAIWRKLQEQLIPIRNRLAHVRMLKSDDAEVVSMWASIVRTRFGA